MAKVLRDRENISERANICLGTPLDVILHQNLEGRPFRFILIQYGATCCKGKEQNQKEILDAENQGELCVIRGFYDHDADLIFDATEREVYFWAEAMDVENAQWFF